MLITGILPGRINSALWNLTYDAVYKSDCVVQSMTRDPSVLQKISTNKFRKEYTLNKAKVAVAVRDRIFNHLRAAAGNIVYTKNTMAYNLVHCRPAGVKYDSSSIDFRHTCRLYHACLNCLFRTSSDVLRTLDSMSTEGAFTTMAVGTIEIPLEYGTCRESEVVYMSDKIRRARRLLSMPSVFVFKRLVISDSDSIASLKGLIVGLSHSSAFSTENRLIMAKDLCSGTWNVTGAMEPSQSTRL